MKNRNIPYGYHYDNGIVVANTKEVVTLKRIIAAYLDGLSLLKIAEQLNSEKAEYMPGVISWNKARIKRLIEDERYLGTDKYPSIIDKDTHQALKRLKDQKNTQKHTNRQADIFQIGVPVYCPTCGSEMRRRHDSRRKCQERWTCQNAECKELIIISDSDLLASITERLNMIIANPDMIQTPTDTEKEPSIEIRRSENEIGRALDSSSFDKAVLRKKMMECVSLKYKDIDSAEYIAKRLKADFEKWGSLSAFSPDLFSRAAKSITPETDRTVSITLINDQQIRKEPIDYADNDTTA